MKVKVIETKTYDRQESDTWRIQSITAINFIFFKRG